MVPEGLKMARTPALHAVDELLSPAFERTVRACDLGDGDAALVALGRVFAGTLDRMSNVERRAMLGQTAPLYLKVLLELESRSLARRKLPVKAGPSRLDQLRVANGRKVP
jgi:hypothetical protein